MRTFVVCLIVFGFGGIGQADAQSRAGERMIQAELSHLDKMAQARRQLELEELAAKIAVEKKKKREAETIEQPVVVPAPASFDSTSFAPGPPLIGGGDSSGGAQDLPSVQSQPVVPLGPLPRFVGRIGDMMALKIGSQVHFVGVGQRAGEFRVESATRDSITLLNRRDEVIRLSMVREASGG